MGSRNASLPVFLLRASLLGVRTFRITEEGRALRFRRGLVPREGEVTPPLSKAAAPGRRSGPALLPQGFVSAVGSRSLWEPEGCGYSPKRMHIKMFTCCQGLGAPLVHVETAVTLALGGAGARS